MSKYPINSTAHYYYYYYCYSCYFILETYKKAYYRLGQLSIHMHRCGKIIIPTTMVLVSQKNININVISFHLHFPPISHHTGKTHLFSFTIVMLVFISLRF